MRTPARDTPVGLRIGRSRQGRFIANSYCTASSPPHITYGCPGSAFVAYLPCLARSCRNSGHEHRAAEDRLSRRCKPAALLHGPDGAVAYQLDTVNFHAVGRETQRVWGGWTFQYARPPRRPGVVG